MANTDSFKVALDEARKSLTDALEQRSAIEQKIVNLKQTIEGLSALCEPEADHDLVDVEEDGLVLSFSLTDAIRLAFTESPETVLTPTEIRDALLANGLSLSRYKQPMVPIHNTLKRLVSQEELVEFRDDNGDLRGYRWVSPLARAVAEVSTKAPAQRSLNAYADLFNSPDMQEKMRAAVRRDPTAAERFKRAHDARDARKKAMRETVEKMREGGSEVGTSPNVDNAYQRSVNKKI
jgi:hypothetical protein